MTAPKPPRLLDIEGGVVVAGTHDPHVALRLAVAGHDSFIHLTRETPSEVVAAWLFTCLRRARTDWYRVVPAMRGFCLCGEGHAWDLYPTAPGRRGGFRVVDLTE